MLRIEVVGILACDAPGCTAELRSTGGASAVAELGRDRGWATAYDRVSGRLAALHLCPRHCDPVGGRRL